MPGNKDPRNIASLLSLGKTRVKALGVAGFTTLEDFANAKAEELVLVDGIGRTRARKIIKDAKRILKEAAESDKAGGPEKAVGPSLFICPACGSLASSESTSCPKCGVRFEEDDEVELPLVAPKEPSPLKESDGFWYREEAKLFLCPSCGSLAASGSKACPACGAEFEQDDKLVDMPLVQVEEDEKTGEGPDTEDGFWYKSQARLFLCPECGSLAAADAKGCPRCGARFAEDEAVEMPLETEGYLPPDGPKAGVSDDVDGHWYREEASLFLCPGCGSLAAPGSKKCPSCGAEFVEEEALELPLTEKASTGDEPKDVDGFWYKDGKGVFICPGCGSLTPEGAVKCQKCGRAVDEKSSVEMPLVEKADAPEEGGPVELFLCPDCGAFLSERATQCSSCGADFGTETAVQPAPAEAEIPPKCPKCGGAAAAPGRFCQTCQPKPSVCKTCGERFEGEGAFCLVCSALEDAIGLDAENAAADAHTVLGGAHEAAASIESRSGCEVCGGQVRDDDSICLDCKIGKLTTRLDGKIHESSKLDARAKRRGISRDFSQRWSGMGATDAAIPSIDQAKLGKADSPKAPAVPTAKKPEAPPKTSEDWFQRGVVLMGEDNLDEAMKCFDRAAELSPGREVDYRAKALALLSKMQGSGTAAEEEEVSRDIENLDARLWFLEESLKSNPRDDRLWQEKGDLLQRRGQSAEATRCFQEAIRLSYERISELEGPATAPLPSGVGVKTRAGGLTNGRMRSPGGRPSGTMDYAKANGRTNGMVNGKGRTNGPGRVNGLVNGRGRTNGKGRVNGLVNGRGRTNGKINGLVNGRGRTNGKGRINGLVNGRGRTNGKVNGLVNGRGRINGLVNGLGFAGGLTNGLGLVNGVGLINGTGFVNGNIAAPRRERHEEGSQWHWMAGIMALAIALMMFSPMLNLGGPRQNALSVDGDFGDWSGIAGYRNAVIPQDQSPDVVIDTIKLGYEPPKLFVYASVMGNALAGRNEPGLNTTASLYAFIDADRDASTGYSVGTMGADFLLDVSGWRGDREGAVLRAFDPARNRTDWLGFDSGAAANAAVSETEMEAEAFLPTNYSAPLVLVCTNDGAGYRDAAESPVSPGLPMARVFEHGPPVDSTAAPGTIEIQRLTLYSSGGASTITGLEFAGVGGAPASVSISTIVASRAGGSTEALSFTSEPDGADVSVTFANPISFANDELVNLSIVGDVGYGASLPNTTGLTLKRVVRDGAGDTHVSKLGPATISVGLWSSIRIDGAFADWDGVPKAADAAGDAVASLGNGLIANQNVDLVSSALLDSGDFYVEVSGIVLGGVDYPSYVLRRGPAPPPDWNISDGDRDGVPNGMDPMPNDFDNDGVNDSLEGGDVDGDGLIDYPNGPDFWLNATVPASFPTPYAGTASMVYVGPISPREMRGEDSVILWADTDGDASTGAPVAGGLGADAAAIITGRAGIVTESATAVYDPSQGAVPWRITGASFETDNDLRRLEGRLPLWMLGVSSQFTVELRDAEGCSDASDSTLSPSNFTAGTRSPAGDNVVINEVVSQPNNGEWIELCNPTSSPINIGGWRLRMGNSNLVVFPANTILGVFGSGTEYYTATFYGNGNELPNGGATILLQVAGTWATVDSFTYGALATGQSWARFKNTTWGMPTDTDTAGDYYISSSPTFRAPNDRTAPEITVGKTGDRTSAQPGDAITYTIWYNNTGDGNARHVWVNDTLPAGTTYASSSTPYASVAGQNVLWTFTNVAPGNYQVDLRAQVGAGVAPGTILTNSVTCAYKDAAGVSLPGTVAQASVTVASPTSLLKINEISSQPNPEWVEICNPTGFSVNVEGWTIYSSFANPIYTFPPGATIGAWGSGSEYFVAYMSQSNRLPNGGTTVTLRNGATVVDSTAYVAMASGQTWSRFKHEDTGIPIDTNSDANDFYVSNNAWLVPEGPTPAAPNDRKRPVMNVEKTASPTAAEPGDLVTFTLWYNNTGDGNAKRVWLNDTLPAGMTYVGASVAPTSINGQLLTWYFASVVHDSVNSISVFATINPTIADGTVLTNTANLAYSDQLQNPMIPSSDTAAVTCRRPQITVVKVADVTDVQAGGTITYTIWYNNTGTRSAAHVWINDTLPTGVTFISATPAPTSISGLVLGWHLTNVAPGSHSITVTVQVNLTTTTGTILTNLVELNYTTSGNNALPGSNDAAVVIVPEFASFVAPIIVCILAPLLTRRAFRKKGPE